MVLRFAFSLGLTLSSAGVLADVSVEQGYFRASPPGASTAAAFLSLHNSDRVPVSLTGAQTPAASSVELHTHVEQGEILQMRRVDAIEIPAQGSLNLQPGGAHIMLIGLRAPLQEGDEQMLMLRLSNGESIHLMLAVRKTQPNGAPAMKLHQPHSTPMPKP